MQYLRMYLTTNVRARIAMLLCDPSHYRMAWKALKSLYGNPLLIARAATAKILQLPNIRSDEPPTLDAYLGGVSDIITTLIRCDQEAEINSPTVVKIALDKLPPQWRITWGEEIAAGHLRMSLDSLMEWLERKLTGQEIGLDIGLNHLGKRQGIDTRGRELPQKVRSHALKTQQGACGICNGEHSVQECSAFRIADRHKRSKLAKEHKLCYGCLRKGHGFRFCRSKKRCRKDGCDRMHHPDLHGEGQASINLQAEQPFFRQASQAEATEESTSRVNNVRGGLPSVALGVIAVQVKGTRGRLMDGGSDTSLASLAFTRKLGLKGRRRQLRIAGVTEERMETAEQLSLRLLTGTGQGHTVNVWPVPRLCEAVRPIASSQVQGEHVRLTGLKLDIPPGPIDLLIGMYHPGLLIPNEIRRPGKRALCYTNRARLGSSGSCTGKQTTERASN